MPGTPKLFAALGAFLGHLFPAWIGFRGGKGVATVPGCLLAIAWPAGLAFAIVWLAVAFLTRTSSAAALTASALTPIILVVMGQTAAALMFGLMVILLWAKHRANIARLLAGTNRGLGRVDGGPPSFSGSARPPRRRRPLDWLRLLRYENIGPRTFAGSAWPPRERQRGARGFAGPDRERQGWPDDPYRDHRGNRAGGRGDASRGRAFYRAWRAGLSGASAAYGFGAAHDCRTRQCFEPSALENRDCRRPQRIGGRARLAQLARGIARAGHVIAGGDRRAGASGDDRSRTIAVLAGGLGNIYPAEHEALLEQIVEHGAAISEMPFGWEARGARFSPPQPYCRGPLPGGCRRRGGSPVWLPHHREIRRRSGAGNLCGAGSTARSAGGSGPMISCATARRSAPKPRM